MSQKSKLLFEEARNWMPGGVNSPVRAFGGVGGEPIFFERGEGAYLFDVDGNQYLDFVGSWGTALVGHTNPAVIEAVQEKAKLGLSFGAPTAGECELAKLVCEWIPSMDKIRLVNSGTEACMSALRLARAFSGKDKFVKFSGCYHGHFDAFLVKAGSGVATFGLPNSPGVPKGVTSDTLICPYNDPSALLELVRDNADSVGSIILEPYVGNSGFIRPSKEFLNALEEAREKYGVLILFDEVMTGFRVGKNSAQGELGFTPDLTMFGKVIGGGLPIGAYGGRSEIMNMVAPAGPVYQAGTLSGNPVAVAAGLATLSICKEADYSKLHSISKNIATSLEKLATKHKHPVRCDAQGGMFGMFFSKELPTSFEQAAQCDHKKFARFFHLMLKEGVYLPPSGYEACFLSFSHGDKEVGLLLEAADKCFAKLEV